MADNQTRLPMPRALTEASANPIRPNTSLLPPPPGTMKRKMPQPTSLQVLQPPSKSSKPSGIGRSLQHLNGTSNSGSGIARPASAASSRHGSSRSIDVGLQKKTSGMRPPGLNGLSRTRPASSMGTVSPGKGDASPDISVNSMTRLSSSSIPFSRPSSRTLGVRHVSQRSSVSSLTSKMDNLSLEPRSYSRHNGQIQREAEMRRHTRLKSRFFPYMPRSPQKSPKKEPVMPSVYLTIESNKRAPPAFDIDSKMSSMNTMLKSMQDGMGSIMSEREVWNQALDLHKSKIAELETSRHQLEENNTALQRDLDLARTTMSMNALEADEARRRHLNEIDDIRRKHLDELDSEKRGYRNEIDELRRESHLSRDQSAKNAKADIERLERQHQTEIDDVRREMNRALEEEQHSRKRDVQNLQEEARHAQKSVVSGQELHLKELKDREERMEQLSRLLERERELSDDLRKQLARSTAQNAELENGTRSLKAQVEFLKSDSKSQTQAFADLEQQTQNALKETEEYRSQLRKEESIRRKLLNQIQDLKGNIRVFCRVRPPLSGDMGSCAQIGFPDTEAECKAIEVLGQEEKSSLGKVTTKTHAYSFDRSFGPSSQNGEIFAELSELVAAVCGGSFNTCIFSYGQTGSGKTFTMASPDGMIARAVDQIFETAEELVSKGWRYTVSGTFVEVYNENINDLLGRPEDFDRKKHEIRHDARAMTTEITDVTEVELQSSDHFTTVLGQALENRSIAATKANERSSRSHSVCILTLQGENHVTGETCRSTLNLVDLAGSERLAHSQATGNRLKETQNINKSLSCLADVIAALGEARDGSHIPYRNSKLTYLLQNSLGGNSKTLMFVMISPLQEHLSETLSSLNFATKVNNTRIMRKPRK